MKRMLLHLFREHIQAAFITLCFGLRLTFIFHFPLRQKWTIFSFFLFLRFLFYFLFILFLQLLFIIINPFSLISIHGVLEILRSLTVYQYPSTTWTLSRFPTFLNILRISPVHDIHVYHMCYCSDVSPAHSVSILRNWSRNRSRKLFWVSSIRMSSKDSKC